jgi:CRISPR/Cas system-associated exonuclease Cas4 (RecB family)
MDLSRCLEGFSQRPLLIPAKTIALGASFCVKKAYLSLMVDGAPSSHVPYSPPFHAQRVHDLLTYLLPHVTYTLLDGKQDPKEAVEEAWASIRDAVEQYGNLTTSDYENYRDAVLGFLQIYVALLRWLQRYKGFTPDNTLVYTERMLVSMPQKSLLEGYTDFLPMVGIPDVILVNARSGYVALIDWKTSLEQRSNQLHYYQLMAYRYVLQKVTTDVDVFLAYLTPTGRKKLVSLTRPLGDIPEVETEYRDVGDMAEKIKITASLLYGLTFCKGMLKVAVEIGKQYGLRAFNARKEKPPCVYCNYRDVCKYRFAKKSELQPEEAKLRSAFYKLYRIALKKKSEEYKHFIETDHKKCVKFDRLIFEGPITIKLSVSLTTKKPLSDEVMKYSLGKTTVYVFSGKDRLNIKFDNGIYSPILFGRYEDDEVEYIRDMNRLEAKIRMISPAFAVRWLPVYILNRLKPNAEIFSNIVVCPGRVPMNIELKAIAVIENAIVRFQQANIDENLKWTIDTLHKIVLSTTDEYD